MKNRVEENLKLTNIDLFPNVKIRNKLNLNFLFSALKDLNYMHFAFPFFMFLLLAILFTLGEITYRKKHRKEKTYTEIFLSYILFFYLGFSALLAAYSNIFQSAQTAALIGWPANPFFQFEVGMANFAFAILGFLSYWIRGKFWEATVIGWILFYVGAFAGHIIRYFTLSDISPLNIGAFIWINDLFMPLFSAFLLIYMRCRK